MHNKLKLRFVVEPKLRTHFFLINEDLRVIGVDPPSL